ncbi:hypothetical protein [Actinoplanes awajinensis]|uniref:hypothetical protein n=1 Tax=Actinoplanes awajinensis TaxID=135946 RepID=UPI000AB39E17|nr:hypothetical protein [Actinoplanes awajinensis]
MFDFEYESDLHIQSAPRWGRIGSLSGTVFAMVGVALAAMTVPTFALVWALQLAGS